MNDGGPFQRLKTWRNIPLSVSGIWTEEDPPRGRRPGRTSHYLYLEHERWRTLPEVEDLEEHSTTFVWNMNGGEPFQPWKTWKNIPLLLSGTRMRLNPSRCGGTFSNQLLFTASVSELECVEVKERNISTLFHLDLDITWSIDENEIFFLFLESRIMYRDTYFETSAVLYFLQRSTSPHRSISCCSRERGRSSRSMLLPLYGLLLGWRECRKSVQVGWTVEGGKGDLWLEELPYLAL